jgi:hypothetical protein
MSFDFEKNKLYDYLYEELLDLFKRFNVFVAGGCITSLFCNREINDIDIYFRTQSNLTNFIRELYELKDKWIVANTKKSTLFKLNNNKLVQIIHIKYFNNPDEIFDTFDFTACMGCFDFSSEEFVLHPDFLKHNAQRRLIFNANTMFPIVSALRIQKYEDKGYTISKAEYLKILLACMNLKINSYEELKEHFGGLYGISYDKIFDINKEFSLENAIEQISDLYINDDYYKQNETIHFDGVDDLINNIIGIPTDYFNFKGKNYKINCDGSIKCIYNDISNGKQLTAQEIIKTKKLYKFVKKIDGKYYSYYDNTFEYKLNEIVIPKNSHLYCGFIENINSFTYCGNKDSVLIELELLDIEDLKEINNGSSITIKKCKFIREVPLDEYKHLSRKTYEINI